VRLAPWPQKAWISIVHACLSRHTIAHISLAARSRCAVYDKMIPHEGRLKICPRKPTRHVSLSSVEIIQKYSIVPKERLAPSPQAPGKGRVPPRHDLHLPSAPLPNPRCAPTQRRASKQALKVCRRVVRYGANQFLRYGRENLGRPSGSQRIRSTLLHEPERRRTWLPRSSHSVNREREKWRVSRVTYQLVTIRWREGLPISRNGRQASPSPRTQEIGGLDIGAIFLWPCSLPR
jgi:hypothetical protein